MSAEMLAIIITIIGFGFFIWGMWLARKQLKKKKQSSDLDKSC